jgi:hypothetical protein
MTRTSVLSATLSVLFVASSAVAIAQSPTPPAAGLIPLGVTVIEMRAIVAGWSAKKDILGKHLLSDHNDDLGAIEDIIITPNDQASFFIIGVGGFLGIPNRLVAIPVRQIKMQNGRFVLAGATKDTVRAMPPFVYSH